VEFNTFWRPACLKKKLSWTSKFVGVAISYLLGTLALAEANVTPGIHMIRSSMAFGVPFRISRIRQTYPDRVLRMPPSKPKRYLS
jgi:hypothetical protein